MRLVDLEPTFFRMPEGQVWPHADSLDQAEGIRFRCPVCGNHTIVCWQPNVPQEHPPTPGRWEMSGTGFEDLTLSNKKRGHSVVLPGDGCKAHFFVRNGEIELC